MEITYIPIKTNIYFNILVNEQDVNLKEEVTDIIENILKKYNISYNNIEVDVYSVVKWIDVSFKISTIDIDEITLICKEIGNKITESTNSTVNTCQIGG